MLEYDDDCALTDYVWKHYRCLMTEFERRVGIAIIARAKADRSRSADFAEMLYHGVGAIDDPDVNTALADGSEVFCRLVRDRLFTERGAAMVINRCPKCARVVRTPKARQCFWCGFAWHGQDGLPPIE